MAAGRSSTRSFKLFGNSISYEDEASSSKASPKAVLDSSSRSFVGETSRSAIKATNKKDNVKWTLALKKLLLVSVEKHGTKKWTAIKNDPEFAVFKDKDTRSLSMQLRHLEEVLGSSEIDIFSVEWTSDLKKLLLIADEKHKADVDKWFGIKNDPKFLVFKEMDTRCLSMQLKHLEEVICGEKSEPEAKENVSAKIDFFCVDKRSCIPAVKSAAVKPAGVLAVKFASPAVKSASPAVKSAIAGVSSVQPTAVKPAGVSSAIAAGVSSVKPAAVKPAGVSSAIAAAVKPAGVSSVQPAADVSVQPAAVKPDGVSSAIAVGALDIVKSKQQLIDEIAGMIDESIAAFKVKVDEDGAALKVKVDEEGASRKAKLDEEGVVLKVKLSKALEKFYLEKFQL